MEIQSEHPTARILYTRSGRGLVKDAKILESQLTRLGWRVALKPINETYIEERLCYYWERAKTRLPGKISHILDRCQLALGKLRLGRPDLQIHLETPFTTYLASARKNWLIPNQEWADMHQLQYLRYLDRILCKTHAALGAYAPFNEKTAFLGFSSPVVEQLPQESRVSINQNLRFLHVAGNNRKKGTGAIVEAWRRHPSWPELNLVVEDPARFLPLPGNVNVLSRISEAELNSLREYSCVVLAPSEVEGFGHVLLEALAWGAVVVTTNAEPMNELVRPESGYLVDWSRKETCRLGHQYFVDADRVSTVVESILNAPSDLLMQKGLEGRRWVESNHQRFEKELKHQLVNWQK